MRTHEKISRILSFTPTPAIGYHLEAHLEPDVLASLKQEGTYGLVLYRVTGILADAPDPIMIEEIPIVEDHSAVYAEFHIVPDRFKRGGVFERVERWRREHA
jgi:hypothetical protein